MVDRSMLAEDDVVAIGGARVTTPVRAAFDQMCRAGVEDGMVCGDAALGARLTTASAVAAYADAHPGTRGVPHARVAAPLHDGRVRSCPESRFRYVWIVVAGLPRPLVNRGVVDDNGWLLGIADLLDDEAGLVGEFDGADHRGLARHSADNVGEEAFQAINLTVVRATALDLWVDRPRLVHRLRDGHGRGRSRDRTRDRFGIRLH